MPKTKPEPRIVVVKMTPLVVHIREAARLLNVSMRYVNGLLKNGEIQGYKQGNRYQITVSSLEDYVAKRVASGGPPQQHRETASLRPHEIPDWMEP